VSIKVDIRDLHKYLARDIKKATKAIEEGQAAAAQRGRTVLVRKTPVDTGQMKGAWKAGKDYIHNDAPHAGIVEKGARPHKVSRAGIESLTEWARRQLGLPDDQAKSVAWAVAKKLEKEGQKGTFFVEELTPKIAKMLQQEVERRLKAGASK